MKYHYANSVILFPNQISKLEPATNVNVIVNTGNHPCITIPDLLKVIATIQACKKESKMLNLYEFFWIALVFHILHFFTKSSKDGKTMVLN